MSTHPYNKAFPRSTASLHKPAVPRPKLSVWADITRDPDTGHVVARDLFKAWAFVLGCLLSLGAAAANLVFGRKPDNLLGEIILTLFAYSGGLQYLKARQTSAAGIPPMGADEPPPPANVPAP